MKKRIVTGKQLSQILGVSPQAVGAAYRKGQLVRDESGLYDLNHEMNRLYLKDRKIAVSKIKIPAPGVAGRPIKTAGPKEPGQIVSPSPVTDVEKSELKKRKLIQQIINLQKKNEELKALHISKGLCVEMIQFNFDITTKEYEVLAKRLSQKLPAVLGIQPTNNNKKTIQKIVSEHTADVLEAIDRLNIKFLNRIDKNENSKRVKEIKPAEISQNLKRLYTQKDLQAYHLSALPKEDLEKIKLLAQIEILEIKNSIAHGELIPRSLIKTFYGELYGIDQAQFLQLPYPMTSLLLGSFGKMDAETNRRTEEVVTCELYETQRRIKNQISKKIQNLNRVSGKNN